MFKYDITSELKLLFLHSSMAADYLRLADANRDYLSEWLIWPPLNRKVADFEAFIKSSIESYAQGTGLFCGIEWKGKLVGNAGFAKIDPLEGCGEIGYWIVEDAQGQGIVTQACQALIQIGFEKLGLETIQIRAASENKRSLEIPKRLGFKFKELQPNAEQIMGRMLDHECWELKRER